MRYYTAALESLVSIVFRLVRSIHRNPDVIRLLRAELRERCSEFAKVKSCDLLVEFLVKTIDADLTIAVLANIDLSDCLVSETV